MEPHILYGAPLSLYTGKARSYLIKAGIAYRERQARSEHFNTVVLPKAGIRTIPIVELADGEVIRDGAAIVEHFERELAYPFTPSSPKQKLISQLLDVIGAEGLLRPAMHYRWNFPDENLDFVMAGFRELFPPGPEQAELAEATANKMRQACQAFGVTDETRVPVESLYKEFLYALNVHLKEHPYLLGGRPSIGDFGLLAPMFAHLGRDPKPLALMQKEAPDVYRWIERMNRRDADIGEFDELPDAYLENDQIPATLLALLKIVAEDFVPETLASADCINSWLESQPNIEAGTPVERGVGFSSFELRGCVCHALAQPYRYYLLAQAQETYETMCEDDRVETDSLLESCALSPLLTCRLSRPIGRSQNREVWL
ncbi:MAG: glutathione S-transferase family protein [Pseudomonadota bacterium]